MHIELGEKTEIQEELLANFYNSKINENISRKVKPLKRLLLKYCRVQKKNCGNK